MVFLSYSTMQMAAKIVYYGPGLGGKTTNLQWIFSRTAKESRGEMVSLETESDRTLFFDLLPIDVGNIAGFTTRLQLYTVPGQVFYNTTRKLVLKGVDGVVFVADSQRAMLQANLDSFRNLEENLADMGLSVDSVPLVLQYNKRDLADVLSVEELNRALNRQNWPWCEAAAIQGTGVFETLKAISKLTLLSLKKRLTQGSGASPRPAAGGRVGGGASSVAVRQVRVDDAAPAGGGEEEKAVAAAASASPPPARDDEMQSAPAATATATAAEAPPKPSPKRRAATGRPQASRSPRQQVDILGELERLRQEATGPATSRARRDAEANGHGQLYRDVQLTLDKADFARARRFSLSLKVEDADSEVVETIRDLAVEIDDPSKLSHILLKLNIAVHSKS